MTVQFGHVCIVSFLRKITKLSGCERSLSRCRRRGNGVFRAGWIVNQDHSTGGWHLPGHERLSPVNHRGC
jgi:hypothetical protein